MIAIGSDPVLLSKHFILTSDLDLSEYLFTHSIIAASEDVIGFSGQLDGNGHVIHNLQISMTSGPFAGLIKIIADGGVVENLILSNAVITCKGGAILAGINQGIIRACHVTGEVEGNYQLGGLAVYNDGQIWNSSADCRVTGQSWYAGGLVCGNGITGQIRQSCSKGIVDGADYVGGLCATNYGRIQDCYSTSSVGGRGYFIGALVGYQEVGVVACCYATGTGASDQLIGLDYGSCLFSRFGHVQPYDMWNWEGNSWYDSEDYAWTVNNNYWENPRLKWEQSEWHIPYRWQFIPFYRMDSSRDGSEESPYLVTNFEFADYPADWDKHFVLTSDLQLEHGSDYCVPYFNGVLDGQGHPIHYTVPNSRGVFGTVGMDAHIRNLGVHNLQLSAPQSCGLLVNFNHGTITACYAKGDLECIRIGGLLAGYNTGRIIDCYAEGSILFLEELYNYNGPYGSGLYGRNLGQVINCWSSVSASVETQDNMFLYSGAGGMNEGLVWNTFWNGDLLVPDASMGGIDCNEPEFHDPATFRGWGDGNWKMAAGFDFPRLAWEDTNWRPESGVDFWEWPDYLPLTDAPRSYGGGSGTETDPYILREPNQLLTLGKHQADCSKYFVLENDLDFAGWQLADAVIGLFNGSFNGQGHTIRNLTITAPLHSCVGLFGYLDAGARVRNLGVQNISLDGLYRVGGLAGENHGVIRECSVQGSLTGTEGVGGFVGINGYFFKRSRPEIYNSYTKPDLFIRNDHESYSTVYGAAGFTSHNDDGIIRNCYTAGSQKRVGWASGECYYGVTVRNYCGLIQDSFWDVIVSGNYSWCTQSDGGTEGVSRGIQAYLDTGWDFTGEPGNGDHEIWRMCADGIAPPRLSWEFGGGGDFACPDGVGVEDLAALAEHWMATGEDNPGFNYAVDGSGDGRVNMVELGILSEHWGE